MNSGRGLGAMMLTIVGGGALMTLLLAISIVALTGALPTGGRAGAYAPSGLASTEIPAHYLRLYQWAARRYGLDWAILAGIGKVECDHGRDPDPSCTEEGAVNAAGAGGPAQFLASTWRRYGVDGDGDGVIDRWDPTDAILSMANYLRSSGAPQNYEAAIFAYNHAGWYVAEVEHWAALYRGPSDSVSAGSASTAFGGSDTPLQMIAGARAALTPNDGHVAMIPAEAPPAVQALIVAGNELQQLPYGVAGHPDPRGATSEDCSSTVNYVLYRAGIRPISEILHDNPLAQSYIDWGQPGPGRWVSIYATTRPTDHVFIVIAGLRLDTSHNGTDVGPNRAQEGPRWRILDYIPTWAHWSVRHPAGL
jgi:Transglycosylase SLT domain